MLIETLFNIQGPYCMPKGYQPRNAIALSEQIRPKKYIATESKYQNRWFWGASIEKAGSAAHALSSVAPEPKAQLKAQS